MNKIAEKALAFLEAVKKTAKTKDGRSQVEFMNVYTEGYAEPGYSDPASGVIATGNWNDVTKYAPGPDGRPHFEHIDDVAARAARGLEAMGVELEWSDEWHQCEACWKLVRCQPNSYGWSQSWAFLDDCTIHCADCIKKDPAGFLEAIEGNANSCVTFDLDMEEAGYVKIQGDFETGFHPGQNASPKEVARELRKAGFKRFVFVLDATGQFDSEWSVWLHRSEADKLDTAQQALATGHTDGPDIIANLSRALQSAPIQPRPADADPHAIEYTTINVETGEATTRWISPEDFVEKGIK